MTTTSTLVETISINYDDFNDSFLTCGTCLCLYDNAEHTPKLLACSHTVCKNCLDRIIDVQGNDTGTFRCPICRESIRVPSGGVNAFPPSFLVNQLLDLISRQPREVIPKCSTHPSEELLFCETCDKVYCKLCGAGNGHNGRGANEHTVIPFAIAIKRMSEILLYKAQLCIKTLNSAYDNVYTEMSHLETSVDKAIESINNSCQDVINLVDKRRHECLTMVRKIRNEKRTALSEQLEMIQTEKTKVQDDCDNMQFQVEVRNISKKIGDLNEKIDSVANLLEPRENSFLKYEYKHNDSCKTIADSLSQFGCIKVSTTFPALSSAFADKAIAHLQSLVHISTVDYHGNPRSTGGDPITATLRNERGEPMDTKIRDNNDGTYAVMFVPQKEGNLKMNIKIFERPIKNTPLDITVTEHNSHIRRFGTRGNGNANLSQPVRVCVGQSGNIYILDTGNSRIKVLDRDLNFIRHIGPAGLESQSGTGLAVAPHEELIVINWRSKNVTTLAQDGCLVNQFTSDSFVEPIDVAVNTRGDIIIADNGACKIFMFDNNGKLLITFGSKGDRDGMFGLISSVAVGKCDEIFVADHRIQIFTKDGKYSRHVPQSCKGSYGGVCVDPSGQILASRTEKGKSFIAMYNSSGKLQFCIDSFADRLKRPTGVCVTNDSHVIIADLGNDCIKQFRYK